MIAVALWVALIVVVCCLFAVAYEWFDEIDRLRARRHDADWDDDELAARRRLYPTHPCDREADER